ncbi:glutathione S-transferase family protein [Achromobacter xylosoxidans]|uniref:glutathione S-transferase family protein n=1 Tax=Achromobacter TaxID=222 RepID=UPI0008A2B996|nr:MULTISPECIES: glutathione S-transferase family protein [Achromobacter]MCH4579985.1 glutathione S-transferase family protein [Achromobacter xylosoxidans]OFU72924.1 glutathione S-transferase [Achromobacter xylosoxidans]PWY43184.1 glutathione S-transferase family protein [Achromobacter sp. RW408]
MKLYYAPGTCAVACWIALKWAGADFEVERADYASETFRRVNPLAMVPALDIGGTRAMTQADAILAYIAELHPHARLGPDDNAPGRFEFGETMAFLTGDFHPAFWPFFTPERFTTDHSQQALDHVRAASHDRIDRVMQHLDRLIGPGSHVYRDRRSAADAYAYVMARWTGKLQKTWKDYPGIARLCTQMEQDPTVQEVLHRSAA